MKKNNRLTRRDFVRRVPLGLGMAVLAGSSSRSAAAKSIEPVARKDRLPREV